MNDDLEYKLNLILWGMNLSHLPEGHTFTEQLQRLQRRSEKKLAQAEIDHEILTEYHTLKDRLTILEHDYASLLGLENERTG